MILFRALILLQGPCSISSSQSRMAGSVPSHVCQCHLAGPHLGYGQILVHLVLLSHWHQHSGASLSVNSSNEPNQLFRIIEYFGVKGTFKGHLARALSRDIFSCIRLLKAPSNLVSNVSWDGTATTSPHSLLPVFCHPYHKLLLP